MNRPWKLVLLLVGIFVAGAVLGSLVTIRVIQQRVANRPVAERWAPLQMKRLVRELELTPAQVEAIQPIMRRSMEELGRVRSRSMQEGRALIEQMQREVSGQLTPEQREKFEKMNREFREKARKFVPDRDGRLRSGKPRDDDGPAAGAPPPQP